MKSQYAYDNQVPQVPPQLSVNTTQPWPSRRGQNQIPSPSTSIRTSRTAPDPRPYSRSSIHEATRSPVDPFLAPAYVSRNNNYNPIARQLLDQPWSAGNLRSSSASGSRNSLSPSNVPYGSYRGHMGPGSDIESNLVPSDSGYHSQAPPSVFSNEAGRNSQDLHPGLTLQVGKMNVESLPSESPARERLHSDQISQRSSRSGLSAKQLPCPECHEVLKCKSEYKCVYVPITNPSNILTCGRTENTCSNTISHSFAII